MDRCAIHRARRPPPRDRLPELPRARVPAWARRRGAQLVRPNELRSEFRESPPLWTSLTGTGRCKVRIMKVYTMRPHIAIFLLGSMLLLHPATWYGWGDEGHEIVGLIAEHYLE